MSTTVQISEISAFMNSLKHTLDRYGVRTTVNKSLDNKMWEITIYGVEYMHTYGDQELNAEFTAYGEKYVFLIIDYRKGASLTLYLQKKDKPLLDYIDKQIIHYYSVEFSGALMTPKFLVLTFKPIEVKA